MKADLFDNRDYCYLSQWRQYFTGSDVLPWDVSVLR